MSGKVLWYPPSVTTPSRIVPTLQRMLRARGVVLPVFTPGHLVDALVEAGVGLNDELASIEIGVAATGTGRLVIDTNAEGLWVIREQVIHGAAEKSGE